MPYLCCSCRVYWQEINSLVFIWQVASVVVATVVVVLALYSQHCVWVTSNAYSSPSIVMAAQRSDGSQILFDDYREAYYWLRQNTPLVRLAHFKIAILNFPTHIS